MVSDCFGFDTCSLYSLTSSRLGESQTDRYEPSLSALVFKWDNSGIYWDSLLLCTLFGIFGHFSPFFTSISRIPQIAGVQGPAKPTQFIVTAWVAWSWGGAGVGQRRQRRGGVLQPAVRASNRRVIPNFSMTDFTFSYLKKIMDIPFYPRPEEYADDNYSQPYRSQEEAIHTSYRWLWHFHFFHFDLFYCTQIQDCYCLRQLAATENWQEILRNGHHGNSASRLRPVPEHERQYR